MYAYDSVPDGSRKSKKGGPSKTARCHGNAPSFGPARQRPYSPGRPAEVANWGLVDGHGRPGVLTTEGQWASQQPTPIREPPIRHLHRSPTGGEIDRGWSRSVFWLHGHNRLAIAIAIAIAIGAAFRKKKERATWKWHRTEGHPVSDAKIDESQ